MTYAYYGWSNLPPLTTNKDGTIRPTAVAIDFDGCIVSNAWPEIGVPNDYFIAALKRFKQGGGQLILWTCREGKMLEDAVNFCCNNGIMLDAINENLPSWIEAFGNDCRKVGADFYIDDKAIRLVFSGEHG